MPFSFMGILCYNKIYAVGFQHSKYAFIEEGACFFSCNGAQRNSCILVT